MKLVFHSASRSVFARLACVVALAISIVGCSRYPGGQQSPPKAPNRSTSDASVERIFFEAPPLFVPPHGGDVSIPVPFRNPSSTSELKLEIASKSCECAGFTLTPDVVEPGGEGVMTLKTTFGSATDERELRLRFDTGLPKPESMVFSVTMRAFPAIEFQPDVSPVLEVLFGQFARLEFDVLCHQPEEEVPLKPEISSDAAELALTLAGQDDRVSFGVRRQTLHYVATITIPSQAEFARSPVIQKSRIDVRAGDQSATFNILWRPENLVRSEPKSLLVNTRQAGFLHKLELTADSAFSIVALDSPLENFVIKAPLGRKRKRHTLSVSFGGSAPPGDGPQKLVIIATTDHPTEKQVEIPIYILD